MRHTEWTTRLAFEMALLLEGSGEDMQDLLQRNNVTKDDIAAFNADKLFLGAVADYRQQIQNKGVLFKMKAAVQAEELLKTSYVLIHHPDVPPSVKADLIKSTVKWAGLDSPSPIEDASGGSGVSITINLGGAETAPLILEATTPTQRQKVISGIDDL